MDYYPRETPSGGVSDANNPDSLTANQRRYYQETWGFDPVTDRKPLRYGKNFLLAIVGQIEEETLEEIELTEETLANDGPKDYCYEAIFSLDEDLGLQFTGVTIAARVEVYAEGPFTTTSCLGKAPA